MRALALLLSFFWFALAWADEGIRLAPGFGVQKLSAALMPNDVWPDAPVLCARSDGLLFAGKSNLWRIGAHEGLLDAAVPIEGFACSEAGTPVLVAAGRLGPLQGRLFVPRVPLPTPATRISGGAGDSLILFETSAPARLFLFDGRQAQLVATFTEPITAVTHAGDFSIVATPTAIWRVRPGEPLGLLLPLIEMKPVVSLAVHPRTAEILFASEDEIFLLDDGRATQIAAGLGGTLAVMQDAIFVADGKRKGIYRLFATSVR
ncbi:hypothetical protein [Sulfuricystis multivorans]|uniref:hypothetical protein n=1 Tax=Sulfuricystis multivorans TaxID=2211108 RepID=UPI000F84AA70|nr:hypothetical protein [Sulfuricystis multivorans]